MFSMPPDQADAAIRPPSEIVTGNLIGTVSHSNVPANRLALGAASAVAAPTSDTAAAPSAASAMHPDRTHRVIDRVIVHLLLVRPSLRVASARRGGPHDVHHGSARRPDGWNPTGRASSPPRPPGGVARTGVSARRGVPSEAPIANLRAQRTPKPTLS